MTGDPIRFTGKELDAETALTYSAARYYRSSLGRFSTADPFNLAGRRTNPQTWNAYSYALNNPLRFVDPSGLWSEPIHRWIIQHAFPGLSPAQQKIMIEASKRMDSVRSHFPGEEYKHGLRAPGQSKADAQRLHLAYVVERQDTAMLFFDYGFTDAGLAVAAQAVHAVVDPTSPMHEDYQLWNLGDGKSTGRHSGGETWAAFTAARRVQAIGAAQRAMGNMMGLAEFLKATGLRFEVFVSETYKIKPDGK